MDRCGLGSNALNAAAAGGDGGGDGDGDGDGDGAPPDATAAAAAAGVTTTMDGSITMSSSMAALVIEQRGAPPNARVFIGDDVSAAVAVPANPALVPDVLFYEIPAHTHLLRAMLQVRLHS
jgi:hypothetical protein